MKITFLIDNKTENPACVAEWGLSMLIETAGHKYLFDTGASGLFAENARVLGVDLMDAECCIISHGHRDHTDGMGAFEAVNKTAPVYLHKDALMPYFGKDEYENSGILWSDELKKALEGRLIFTEGVYRINDHLTLAGNIPNYEGYEPTETFYTVKDGQRVPDPMDHEQFLVVEEGESIHIISGCCHKGLIPSIMYAKQLFPGKKLASFTGGLHTYRLDAPARLELVRQLRELGLEKIVPLHCTGMNMILTFRQELGDGCIIACAGDCIEL